jgi:small-conductance mechanosensitive channel
MSPILEYLQNLTSEVVDFFPKLLLGLMIFALAYVISRWTARLVRRSLTRRGRDPELIVLLVLLTRWGILIAGIIFAAEVTAEGTLGSLIAGLGIAGFTIGFALQDVAKNFVAGILLLLQQPFELGDSIEVAGYGGQVRAISLRTTELRTWDGRFVLIPNTDIFTSPIVNFTRANPRRIELVVGVAADSDLDKVTRITLAAIADVTGVLEEPSPSVVFNTFGESTIDFKLFYWVDMDATGFNEATDEGIKNLKTAFESEGIELPYPTLTVHTNPSS